MNNKFKKLRAAAEKARTILALAELHCTHQVGKVGENAECMHCGKYFGQWIFYDYPKNYFKKGVRSKPKTIRDALRRTPRALAEKRFDD